MSAVMSDFPRRHRITVDEYYRMAEVGLLAPDARTELIEGEIFDMAPIGTEHASVTDRLAWLFERAFGGTVIVRTGGSVRLTDFSEPQPDIAILKFREDFYKHAHPGPQDVLLIVEVSDSTLRFDLKKKFSLYARYGITEYWVANLKDNQLHIFRNPTGLTYAGSSVLSNPGKTAIAAVPDKSVDLSGLFES